jgi:hypothetical protein
VGGSRERREDSRVVQKRLRGVADVPGSVPVPALVFAFRFRA